MPNTLFRFRRPGTSVGRTIGGVSEFSPYTIPNLSGVAQGSTSFGPAIALGSASYSVPGRFGALNDDVDILLCFRIRSLPATGAFVIALNSTATININPIIAGVVLNPSGTVAAMNRGFSSSPQLATSAQAFAAGATVVLHARVGKISRSITVRGFAPVVQSGANLGMNGANTILGGGGAYAPYPDLAQVDLLIARVARGLSETDISRFLADPSSAYLSSQLWPVAVSSGSSPTLTTSLSVAVQRAQILTSSLSTAITSTPTSTSTVDSAIQAVNTSQTQLNQAIQQVRSGVTGIESAIQVTRLQTSGLDAALQLARSATIALDIAVGVQNNVTSSISLQVQAGYTSSTSLNLQVQSGNNVSLAVSTAILRQALIAADLNTAVQITGSSTASLSTALQIARTAATALNSALQLAKSATANINLQIQDGVSRLASIDAAIEQTKFAVSSIQLAIARFATASTNLDAALMLHRAIAAILSATVRESRSISSTLNLHVLSSASGIGLSELVTGATLLERRIAMSIVNSSIIGRPHDSLISGQSYSRLDS